MCAVAACNLIKETESRGIKLILSAKETMNRDRGGECDQFTTWMPGLTPKEHIDMNLLQQQRILDAKILKETRAREDQRDRLVNERADRLASEQKSREDKRDFRQGIYLILAAIIGAVAAGLFYRYLPPPSAPPAVQSSHAVPDTEKWV